MKSHWYAEFTVYLSHPITLVSIDKHDSNGKRDFGLDNTKDLNS